MIVSLLILVFGYFMASFSQVLLKIAARKYGQDGEGLQQYLNLYVITAYSIFLVTTVISVIALKQVPLMVAAVLETLGQVFVAGLSYFILKEKATRKHVIGMVLIIIGSIVIFI